jgi:hypothetical protein
MYNTVQMVTFPYGVTMNGMPMYQFNKTEIVNKANEGYAILVLGGYYADADSDGCTNYDEASGACAGPAFNNTWTNPTLADTDHDGVPDGVERTNGTNPADPASH